MTKRLSSSAHTEPDPLTPEPFLATPENERPESDDELTVHLRQPTSSEEDEAPAPVLRPSLPESGEKLVGAIGDYDLLEEIGSGGMGVVYKARNRPLDRIVALKVTHLNFSEDRARQRFQAEAEAAARLDHPNIVPIYEMKELGREHYFSMAFVEGESLADRVCEGPFPPKQAAELMNIVTEAVAYAHERGVIHRDLKPDNILLDSSGQPRITDFGLAKCLDSDKHLTQEGEVMGTPGYMPPEQVQSMDLVGPTADIYALGASLYCLITGRPPFQSANSWETLNQVVEQEPVPPRQLNASIPHDLETICLKCLRKRPDQRYSSATELAEDLGRYLRGQPILARRASFVEKGLRWCRRNPVFAAWLASISCVILLAFVIVSRSYSKAESARAQAEQNQALERWERYRSHIAAVASAFQLSNAGTAKRFLMTSPPEHRGWEWRHFASRLEGAQLILDEPGLTSGGCPWYALSPEDRFLVLGLADGELEWRDSVTGELLATTKHRREITTLLFDPSSKFLVSGSADGEMRVWTVPESVEKDSIPSIRLEGFSDRVDLIRFDRAGNLIAASAVGQGVRIWNIRTGRSVYENALRSHCRVAFAPDLTKLAYSWEGTIFVLDRNHLDRPPLELRGHETRVARYCFDSTGTRLASCSDYPDCNVRIWDTETGEPVALLRGHINAVTSLVFNPVGNRLVTGSRDQTLRLWDSISGNLIGVARGHVGPVFEVEYCSDGSTFVSSSEDGTSRLWDGITGQPLGVLYGHREAIYELQYNRSGTRLVSRSVDRSVRVWDVRLCNAVPFRAHSSYVYDVAFTPDGKRIASTAWDGSLIVWDVDSRQPVLRSNHHAPIVSSVAIGRDSYVTMSRYPEDRLGRWVTIWDSRSGERRGSLHLPRSNFKDGGVAFHPKLDRFAFCDALGEIHSLDLRTGQSMGSYQGRGHQMLDVDFSPDGAELAAGSTMGDVFIWDAKTRELRATLKGHSNDVVRVQYNRAGDLLASASGDHSVRLWDTKTHRLVAELPHGCGVYGLAFSPNGSRLATGCADNAIRLWDLHSHQIVAELRGHDDYVHSLDFSPDGTRLVSGSGDSTIRIWDTLSPRERAQLDK